MGTFTIKDPIPDRSTVLLGGGIITLLVVGVVGLGFLINHSLDKECSNHCQGQGKEMVSMTLFGCGCAPPDHPGPAAELQE